MVGNAQNVSENAQMATKAGWTASADAPVCAMCSQPIAKGERWDVEAAGIAPRLQANARWSGATFHMGCGGCFKCGTKSSLELDAIGGLWCANHMKQRIAAAGGPVRASDAAALLSTEKLFVRPAVTPPAYIAPVTNSW